MHSYKIRSATIEDAARIVDIYNPYVANTAISFEESPVSPQEMATRIKKVQEANLPWLMAEHGGIVVGYAYVASSSGSGMTLAIGKSSSKPSQ